MNPSAVEVCDNGVDDDCDGTANGCGITGGTVSPDIRFAGESEEEAATRTLIEREVALPHADEATCRAYFERNRSRYASAPLLAARHILLACPADDAEERSQARDQAQALIAELQAQPERFAHLDFQHFWLQPMDGPEREANTEAAIAYCLANPPWRLSLQTHKMIGIA